MKPKPKKLDAEPILRQLAEMRKSIPYLQPKPPRPAIDGRAPAIDGSSHWTEEDFEYAALADGLESLAEDIRLSVDYARAQALEKALEVYYATEELSRDPEHADLIPHVEKMRAAYERDYGHPIPPKGTPKPK
ncbi:MAG TPA: hypothetical protein VGF48_13080 [Thermoanaerobaculia bacterium]